MLCGVLSWYEQWYRIIEISAHMCAFSKQILEYIFVAECSPMGMKEAYINVTTNVLVLNVHRWTLHKFILLFYIFTISEDIAFVMNENTSEYMHKVTTY